jgi:hypothetical protein
MEKKYIEFDRLDDSGFHAGPDQNWIVWEIGWQWDQIKHFQSIFGKVSHSENLFVVTELFGSQSILTIGGLSGELVEPETFLDLKYPSGRSMERSWQYLWKPGHLSEQLINVDLNTYNESIEKFFEQPTATAIFKDIVALKASEYGQQNIAVTQIPLRRLPGMIKKGLIWRLETTEI